LIFNCHIAIGFILIFPVSADAVSVHNARELVEAISLEVSEFSCVDNY
jgi:hypothetical protein